MRVVLSGLPNNKKIDDRPTCFTMTESTCSEEPPLAHPSSLHRICTSCGRPGHLSDSCWKCGLCGKGHLGECRKCEKCDGYGHRAERCPTEHCLTCDRFGHTSQSCPNQPCNKCRRHHRGECWVCAHCPKGCFHHQRWRKDGRYGHLATACWKCETCGKYGHQAKNCPVERDMSSWCSNCNKMGHASEECWKCTNCGRYGHEADYCYQCEHCGRHGHRTADCKSPMCTKCGKVGHLAEVCVSLRCTICMYVIYRHTFEPAEELTCPKCANRSLAVFRNE
jgi:Zinc knuckle